MINFNFHTRCQKRDEFTDNYAYYFYCFVKPMFREYSGMYIALHPVSGIVASGSSIAAVKQQLVSIGIQRKDVIIDLLPDML